MENATLFDGDSRIVAPASAFVPRCSRARAGLFFSRGYWMRRRPEMWGV